MIKIETTATVITTCFLTDEDAVRKLFWSNELNIYSHSTESDFHTESIDLVSEEEKDDWIY